VKRTSPKSLFLPDLYKQLFTLTNILFTALEDELSRFVVVVFHFLFSFLTDSKCELSRSAMEGDKASNVVEGIIQKKNEFSGFFLDEKQTEMARELAENYKCFMTLMRLCDKKETLEHYMNLFEADNFAEFVFTTLKSEGTSPLFFFLRFFFF
jgi:hypothetical protein